MFLNPQKMMLPNVSGSLNVLLFFKSLNQRQRLIQHLHINFDEWEILSYNINILG